jgi:hypothetical protein
LNINKRLARGVGLLLIVFLLAPIEDGCKYDKAAASRGHKAAVHSVRPVTSRTKGIRL